MPIYISDSRKIHPKDAAELPDALFEADDDSSKFQIGWREWVALPTIGIPGIKAKVDTGARTSALHTHSYSISEKNGKEIVRFQLHPLRKMPSIELSCEAEVTGHREVKDSGGHTKLRPFIKTFVRIWDFEWPVELNLTNRESMKFRMLLGRSALLGLFVVDPGASYLMGKSLEDAYVNM